MTPARGVIRSDDGVSSAASWAAFILLFAWMLSCVPVLAEEPPSSNMLIVIDATVESSGCVVAKATGMLSVLALPLETTIAGARSQPDGVLVSLHSLLVTTDTRDFSGLFYVEQPDRSCGIRIVGKCPAQRGDVVSVTGTIYTTAGERLIEAEEISAGS